MFCYAKYAECSFQPAHIVVGMYLTLVHFAGRALKLSNCLYIADNTCSLFSYDPIAKIVYSCPQFHISSYNDIVMY